MKKLGKLCKQLKQIKGLGGGRCWTIEDVKRTEDDGRWENDCEKSVSCMRVLCIYRTLLAAQKRIRTAILSINHSLFTLVLACPHSPWLLSFLMRLLCCSAGFGSGVGSGNAGFSSRKYLVCLGPFCIVGLTDGNIKDQHSQNAFFNPGGVGAPIVKETTSLNTIRWATAFARRDIYGGTACKFCRFHKGRLPPEPPV